MPLSNSVFYDIFRSFTIGFAGTQRVNRDRGVSSEFLLLKHTGTGVLVLVPTGTSTRVSLCFWGLDCITFCIAILRHLYAATAIRRQRKSLPRLKSSISNNKKV